MSNECFVVALVSGKGGTGKTTLTANFGVELASAWRGRGIELSEEKNRVLVIDNDYATGGASYLLAGGERLKTGVESQMIQPQTCFYDCYSRRIPPQDVTPLRLLFEDRTMGEFEVHVLLNSLGWWKTPLPEMMDEGESPMPETESAGFVDRELLPYYESLIEHFRLFYDYIIIDSRGGADMRASVAAVVADSIVIVTEPGEVAEKQDLSFVQSLRMLAAQIDRRVGGVSVIYNRVLENEKKTRDRSSDLT
ncbi:MAG: ParA family protein, partial [Verrucomicrobiota bacterium]